MNSTPVLSSELRKLLQGFLLIFLLTLSALNTSSQNIFYNVARNTGTPYNSISATGTAISSWRNGNQTDDNLSNTIPIGFSFNYAGTARTGVLISTNGFLTFNTSSSSNGATSSTYNALNSGLSTNSALNMSPLTVAPFWDDLTCQGNSNLLSGLNSSIRYQTTGTSPNRVFTVEWISMEPILIQGANLNFQVKLYETSGNIEFVYGAMVGFFGNIVPNTAGAHSYSCGMNGATLSNPITSGQLLTQQISNTRSFAATAQDSLARVPDCYSSLVFTPGSYTAYVPTAITVVNDNPAGAITLAINSAPCTDLCGSIYSSSNATASGQAAVVSGTADDDVWFKFTALAATTTVRVYSSTSYRGTIELWNSSATTRLASAVALSAGQTQSIASSTLSPGTQYLVRVYHSQAGWGTTGEFGICVFNTPAPPSNNDCAGAIALPVNATCSQTAGSSIAATASTGIPTCSVTSSNPDDDVWYSFVAPNPTVVVTVTGGQKYNAAVQLFTGACGSLTSIRCNDSTKNAQPEVVTASGLTVGQTYYVRVFQVSTGAGWGNFSICLTSPSPGCVTTQIPGNATTNIPYTGTTLSWNKVAYATGYDVYLYPYLSTPVTIAVNHPDTFLFSGLLSKGFTYNYQVIPRNATGSASSCNTVVFATEPFGYNLIVRTYLEGFYTGSGTMLATINPTDTITDTITVSLRNTTSPFAVQYTSKALLNTTGTAYAEFPQPALLRTYFITVENRNHLEIWSAAGFYFGQPDTNYNFTTAANKAYGSNQAALSGGFFGLRSGDVNQDDAINLNDLLWMDSKVSQFSPIYRPEDLNGDQVFESSDYSFLENRISSGWLLSRP